MTTVPPTTDKRPDHAPLSRERLRHKRLEIARARGIPTANQPAGPSADILRSLLAAGFRADSIGRAAGLSGPTIRNIARGEWSRVHRRSAARIRRLTPATVIAAQIPAGLVPTTGTARRIQALHWMGWRHSDITDRAGFAAGHILSRTHITAHKHRVICAIYDELWDTQGPSAESATRARRSGWAPPMAWDDDTIDDPTAAPAAPGSRRRGLDLDEVATLAARGWTSSQIAVRLATTADAITLAARRAGRTELTAVLVRNHRHRDQTMPGADRAAAA